MTVKFTVTAPTLPNDPATDAPKVINLDTTGINIPFPVPGSYIVTATSPAGSTATEEITETLVLDGFTVVNGKKIAEFPYAEIPQVGTILGDFLQGLDATFELSISNP